MLMSSWLKYIFNFWLLLLLGTLTLASQNTIAEIDGSIQLGSSESLDPTPGTIQWTGSDVKGWNGYFWVSLTGFATTSFELDYNGNKYPTIRIGNREWMAANLRVKHYNDGTLIIPVEDAETWNDATYGAWCNYGNIPSNDDPYGKLYNWFAVGSGKLCPTDWHVATNDDWASLSSYYGHGLRVPGTNYWLSPNEGATNEIGFSAVGGGWRNWYSPNNFEGFRENTVFWTANEQSANNGWKKTLSYQNSRTGSGTEKKESGLSVRCVKN